MTDQSARLAGSVSHISLMNRPFGAPRMHMSESAESAPASEDIGSSFATLESPAETGADISVSQAARALQAARFKKPPTETTEQAAESAETATAETELAEEANAAPAEEQATGETQETDPPAKAPLELPRSWTKDRAEYWAKLDPDTQAFLLDQDRKASAEVRRVQNEAAEKLKGMTAKEQQAEQAKVQYEGKLKSVVDMLEKEQLREFPEIRSQADLDKLALDHARLSTEAAQLWGTDPFAAGPKLAEAQIIQGKLESWRLHQQKLAAAHNDLQQTEQRQAEIRQTEWTNHIQAENALAAEAIPELADKVKGPALQNRVVAELFPDLGFKPEELNDLAAGKSKLSIYDHRLQKLFADSLKLRDIQKAKVVAAPKPLPPVQRPGNAPPRGAVESEQIQALNRKLDTSGSLRDAMALRAAQTRAASRRAS